MGIDPYEFNFKNLLFAFRCFYFKLIMIGENGDGWRFSRMKAYRVYVEYEKRQANICDICAPLPLSAIRIIKIQIGHRNTRTGQHTAAGL